MKIRNEAEFPEDRGGLLRLLARHRCKRETFCHLLQGEEERAVSFAAFFVGAAQFRRHYEAAGIARGAVIIIATEFSLEECAPLSAR